MTDVTGISRQSIEIDGVARYVKDIRPVVAEELNGRECCWGSRFTF